jgi:hypothetical protein
MGAWGKASDLIPLTAGARAGTTPIHWVRAAPGRRALRDQLIGVATARRYRKDEAWDAPSVAQITSEVLLGFYIISTLAHFVEVAMEYNIEVFKRLYPVLNDFLYHYISYKEMFEIIDDFPGEKEFWVRTCDAHFKIATASWCMVFGSEKTNPTHWKNVCIQDKEDTIKEFRNYILNQGNITEDQWNSYWNDMVGFRNQYIVHRELDFFNPVPYFDLAFKVATWFDLWIREKIKPDYLDYDSLDKISLRYREIIRDTLVAVKR